MGNFASGLSIKRLKKTALRLSEELTNVMIPQDNVHIFNKRRGCSRFFVEHVWICELMTGGGAQVVQWKTKPMNGDFLTADVYLLQLQLVSTHQGSSKKSTTSVFALSTSSLYIYEHNRGGAWSLSCRETEAKNITIHHQSWTPPPLVIYEPPL